MCVRERERRRQKWERSQETYTRHCFLFRSRSCFHPCKCKTQLLCRARRFPIISLLINNNFLCAARRKTQLFLLTLDPNLKLQHTSAGHFPYPLLLLLLLLLLLSNIKKYLCAHIIYMYTHVLFIYLFKNNVPFARFILLVSHYPHSSNFSAPTM